MSFYPAGSSRSDLFLNDLGQLLGKGVDGVGVGIDDDMGGALVY